VQNGGDETMDLQRGLVGLYWREVTMVVKYSPPRTTAQTKKLEKSRERLAELKAVVLRRMREDKVGKKEEEEDRVVELVCLGFGGG
jgi:hypothetical protein